MGNKQNKKSEPTQGTTRLRYRVDLVLIGYIGSGRTTLYNQLKIIYNIGFSDRERTKIKECIKKGCLSSFQTAVGSNYFYPPQETNLYDSVENVLDSNNLNQCYREIQLLWEDPNIRLSYDKTCEETLTRHPNLPYFIPNLEKYLNKDYQITDEDIIQSNVRTTRINNMNLDVDLIEYNFSDGWQSTEYLDLNFAEFVKSLDAAIYIINLGDYNTRTYNGTKRAIDLHLEHFKLYVKNPNFKPKYWILLFNKTDLFESKIKQYPLDESFPEINEADGNNCDVGYRHIINLFTTPLEHYNQKFYYFTTCFVETQKVVELFDQIRQIVTVNMTEDNLKS